MQHLGGVNRSVRIPWPGRSSEPLIEAHPPARTADLSLGGNKTETLPKDLGMKARVEGSAVDVGASEWHPDQ